MSKTSDESKRLMDQVNEIMAENDDSYDFSSNLASLDDTQDINDLVLYDYEDDMRKSRDLSDEVLRTLVDLYLNEVPALKEHPYIKNKMKEDAIVYADSIFLSKLTKKNFITQLEQIDQGDASARMHEVVNQTIGQIRENTKFLANQRTDLEKFYKALRNDFIESIETSQNSSYTSTKNNPVGETEGDEPTQDEGMITDNRSLNDMINQVLLKKEESKNRK